MKRSGRFSGSGKRSGKGNPTKAKVGGSSSSNRGKLHLSWDEDIASSSDEDDTGKTEQSDS